MELILSQILPVQDAEAFALAVLISYFPAAIDCFWVQFHRIFSLVCFLGLIYHGPQCLTEPQKERKPYYQISHLS